MRTMRQVEPAAYLPPSNEVLLEVQVSNFIKDFLFSGVDDCKTAAASSASRIDTAIPVKAQLVFQPSALEGQGSFGIKENDATSMPCEAPSKTGFCQQNGAVLVDIPTQSSIWTYDSPSACQTSSTSSSSDGRQVFESSDSSEETKVKEDGLSQKGTEEGSQTLTTSSAWIYSGNWIEATPGKEKGRSEGGASPVIRDSQAIVEGREGKLMNGAQICRTETFPCKSKTQKERDCIVTYDAGTEIKHSCRKPPRPPPPRLTRHSSDRAGCPSVTRCASDASFLLQSCRKAKMDRRRKMAIASSTSSATPFWALIFTVCFAVAMILQGVSSQGSRIAAVTHATTPAGAKSPPSLKTHLLAASQPKASPSDVVHGFDGRKFSNRSKKGDPEDVQRGGTMQVLPILKDFDFHSSRISTS